MDVHALDSPFLSYHIFVGIMESETPIIRAN